MPTGASGLSANFTAASAPTAGTVTLQKGSVINDTVYVDVVVTDVVTLFGASIKLDYDSTRVIWTGSYAQGSVLEGGGATIYEVALDGSVGEGRMIIGIVGSSAVSGSGTLISLPFKVIRSGTSEIAFNSDSRLTDADAPVPNSLSLLFYGGEMTGF